MRRVASEKSERSERSEREKRELSTIEESESSTLELPSLGQQSLQPRACGEKRPFWALLV